MSILNIILLPFNLIKFILKIFARLILNDEIKHQEKRLKESYTESGRLRDQLCKLTKEKEGLAKKEERLKKIIEFHKDKQLEISLTKYGEIAVFAYYKDSLFVTISLLGENGHDNYGDCKIHMEDNIKGLKVVDFSSNYSSRNRGYGRTLLEFVIEKAKRENKKCIYGDLSPVDYERFEWLLPFYESFGFECNVPEDILINRSKGKAYLNLDNSI